jgi:hypothetical protein
MLIRPIPTAAVLAAVTLAIAGCAAAGTLERLHVGAPTGRVAQEPVTTPYPPKGSGAEFTEYLAPVRPRNQYLVGGLLACAGSLVGVLLMLERRRILGLSLCATSVIAGLFLMLGRFP